MTIPKIGSLYNSKVVGFDDQSQERGSLTVSKMKPVANANTDLLGLSEENEVELFEVYLTGEDHPFRINFYN